MQQVSNAYAQAITAGYRRILPRALIDITDPDLVYDPVTSSGQSWVSVAQELCNKVFDTPSVRQSGKRTLDAGWISCAASGYAEYHRRKRLCRRCA